MKEAAALPPGIDVEETAVVDHAVEEAALPPALD